MNAHATIIPPVRAIVLGDKRRIRLGAYVAAWRATIEAPESATFRGSPSDPAGWRGSYTRAEVLAEFRAGMHDRINRHVPGFGRGRKWSPDWYASTRRLADAVNTPRLVVRLHGNPAAKEFADRLGDRLELDRDFY